MTEEQLEFISQQTQHFIINLLTKPGQATKVKRGDDEEVEQVMMQLFTEIGDAYGFITPVKFAARALKVYWPESNLDESN